MSTTTASTDLLLHGIPQELQERAAAAARRAGLSLVDVVRMTFTRLANGDCLPFDPLDEYADEEPNEETLEALREIEAGGLRVYENQQEMLEAFAAREKALEC